MSQPTQTWKHTERRIARQLGGRRMGPGADRADVRSEWLSIEVKHRKQTPAWLKHAVAQARGDAAPDQLGIAVLHEAGQRSDSDLVVLALADFRAWFGNEAATDEL